MVGTEVCDGREDVAGAVVAGAGAGAALLGSDGETGGRADGVAAGARISSRNH